ncbi:filament integrity protein FraC [Oscillatoria salina]|uniref:filament integrity protein FraC n=1 Tax=Oscillatoria salina TaxID=331517 RepID=UPI0013B806CF|nr:filament integrity protein FraC [Oscillatoria salina]MBZ8182295.1 hypothetical protein [Oscillatoria salina IIICB1]NET89180.1 hypothetical protein [Kamptonema sp. SIO1D9]
MPSLILPLPTILVQSVLLLLAIALEGFVLHKQLNLTRKTSIEYSISINLYSTFIGWLLFFLLPVSENNFLELNFISFIYFNNFYGSSGEVWSVYQTIFLSCVIFFFLICLIELKLLDLLEALIQTSEEHESDPEATGRSVILKKRITVAFLKTEPSKVSAIIIANGLSYTLILAILFILQITE